MTRFRTYGYIYYIDIYTYMHIPPTSHFPIKNKQQTPQKTKQKEGKKGKEGRREGAKEGKKRQRSLGE